MRIQKIRRLATVGMVSAALLAGGVITAAAPATAAPAPAAVTHTITLGTVPASVNPLTLAWLPSHKCFFNAFEWATVSFRIDTIGTTKKVWQMKMTSAEGKINHAQILEQRGSTQYHSGEYNGPASANWTGPANGTGLVYMAAGAKRYAKATIHRNTAIESYCYQTLEFA